MRLMRKKRTWFTILMLVMCVIGFGCKKKSANEKELVLTVDDTKIYLDEMMYYIWAMESECAYYEDLYLREYNMDYWEQELEEGVTTRDFIKEDIMHGVIRTNIIWKQAIEEGITLTKEEKDICQEEATELLKSLTESQKNTMQLSKDQLTNILEKEKIVNLFYEDKVTTFHIDKEAIKASIDVDLEEYEVDMISILKEEEIEGKSAYQEMELLLEASKSNDDWESFVDNQSHFIFESFIFTQADETVDQAVKDAVLMLSKGEVSSIIETSDSYVIIKLLNKNETNAYQDAVESAIKNAEFTEFEAYYEELKKEADISIEEAVWEPLVIGHMTLEMKSDDK